MPRPVQLTDSLETTALGFGCADLYREPRSRERLRLLDSAYEAGIRHFDVAPMYGLGIAEREVGRFARGRRDSVVIASKFGLEPTAAARQLARIQAPMRAVLRALPALRRRARASAAGPGSGPLGARLYTSPGYDSASARGSLEKTLGELGTDYVDLLLLHDPAPHEVAFDELQQVLDDLVRSGLIRAWGVAGEPTPTLEVASSFSGPVPVLQVREDIFLRAESDLRPGPRRARIIFGVLGQALPRLVAHLSAAPARLERWSEVLDVDCGDPEQLARLLLQDALRANDPGVVLVSTVRPARMRDAARTASMPPEAHAAKVDAFRALVRSELPQDARTPGVDR